MEYVCHEHSQVIVAIFLFILISLVMRLRESEFNKLVNKDENIRKLNKGSHFQGKYPFAPLYITDSQLRKKHIILALKRILYIITIFTLILMWRDIQEHIGCQL